MIALVEKGHVKASNFKNEQKLVYTYTLTSAGINFKKEQTLALTRRKQTGLEVVKKEIKVVKAELSK